MSKCEECGQEKPKNREYEVLCVGIAKQGRLFGEKTYTEKAESVESCIKNFIRNWHCDNAISINFTVTKRP